MVGKMRLCLIGSVIWWLIGCQATVTPASTSLSEVTDFPPRTAVTATVTLPALPVHSLTGTATPASYPSPDVDQAPAQPYPVTSGLPAPVLVLPTATAVPLSPPTLTPPPTATAGPTAVVLEEEEGAFTAVPLTPNAPISSGHSNDPDEHFWLRRPAPEGSIVWTNKHYPYGGTRGGTLRPHHGVEFDVPYNTPIFAAARGTVVFAGRDDVILLGPHANFYGGVVVIQHEFLWLDQPVYTLYAHLNQIFVSEGQAVPMDTPIAESGATGVADGPHLHFEVRVGENSYEATRNPVLWLYPFPGRGVVAGRVVDGAGNLLFEAPVTLLPLDGTGFSASTTSYAGLSLNGDERVQENFALDDVPAGRYEVVVQGERGKYKAEVVVVPLRTAVVEIVVE